MHTSYESSMHMRSIHTMDTLLGDVYYVYELVVLYSRVWIIRVVCMYAYCMHRSKLVRCIQYDRLRCMAATSG